MLVPVGALPDDPLVAAARFHGNVVPVVLAALDQAPDLITLHFAPADSGHEDWRRAALASLARAVTPVRVNGVASDDPAAVAAVQAYLAQAPGVTGHYLVTDSTGLS